MKRGGASGAVELDGEGRPVKQIDLDGGTTEIAYYEDGEQQGLLKSVQPPAGSALSYSYDASGRMSGMKVGEAYALSLRYDESHRPIALTQAPVRWEKEPEKTRERPTRYLRRAEGVPGILYLSCRSRGWDALMRISGTGQTLEIRRVG